MAVEAGWLGRRAGSRSERGQPRWVLLSANMALALAAICGALEVFHVARLTAGVQSLALTSAGLATVIILAAFALRWMHAALEGRVELLTQALDASQDAQLIVGPDGRTAYANLAFDALFPDGGEPALDRVAAALADDPQADADFRRLRSQAAVGARAIAALPLRDPRGGTAGWFTISVNPIAGRPGYSFWAVQDVTARHEMEAVIRDERNKLVDFLDHAPIGAYSVDGNGRFLFVNQTLGEWLGATPADIVGDGRHLRDFVGAAAEMTAPHDPFCGHDDGSGRGEVVLRGRQGRVVHAWIGQSVVGSGSELRTRSVVRDLTPEREWESARERFQHFFADAPVGIALVDRDGRFAEANRAVGDLIGAPEAVLIGQRLTDFLTEEDRGGIAARLAAAAAGQTLPGPLEFRLKAPRERTMVAFLSRLGGVPGGGERSLILHVIDVTEQKHLEAQFAQSQKMQAVGQLAGGVAHDFNNLLTAMTGFCDLLLLRFRPGDPSYADIMQIKQNANRAAGLVRQLLAFSRQQPLQPRVLDITDVLYELRHLLQRLIGENIELKLVHGRDLGLVKVDQGYFEQVIINLAVNARDAMPSGGTVTIRTANVSEPEPVRRGPEIMPAGDYLLIEVADTGVGIPKENLARIFEPFFTTKEVGSGTGLGLSTVYGIVRQTGGFVFVDSAPGEGAQFRIYLPRHHAAADAALDRLDGGEPAATRDLTGIGTVMLVEDDDPVRIFGARALRNKGYKVIEAKSGEAALELIRNTTEPIDLLITDVVMPRLDGPGLIRHVREIHPDMKVIFISGYTEDSFRQRLDTDREIHFLPKPFSLKQLAAKVKGVISGDEG